MMLLVRQKRRTKKAGQQSGHHALLLRPAVYVQRQDHRELRRNKRAVSDRPDDLLEALLRHKAAATRYDWTPIRAVAANDIEASDPLLQQPPVLQSR